MTALRGNAHLREEIRRGGLAQACVLCGPEGSGRHTAARLLAAAAVCTGEGPKPCGACKACRKVAAGEHPDVSWIRKEGKTQIKVDQARDLRLDAYVRPTEAENRVFIVENAQEMNANAANALLKVLEEPPAHARFILLCEHSEQLLPTVISRCRVFHLEPLSPEEGEELLRELCPGASPEERRNALASSAGYAGPAIRRLTDDRREEVAAALDFLAAVGARSEADMFSAALRLEKTDREDLPVFLDTVTEGIASALELRAGLDRPEAGEEARALSSRYSTAQLLQLRDACEDLRDGVRFNLRPLNAAVALCASAAKIVM